MPPLKIKSFLKSNKMLGKIKDLAKIILAVKNWPVVLIALIFKKKAVVKFRRGKVAPVFVCDNWWPLMAYANFFRFFPAAAIDGSVATIDWHGRKVVLDFGWLTPGELGEVFGQESYGEYFDDAVLAGKTVLDIGAAFGDSLVWFALKGAARVIGIEPMPSFVALCLKNVALNHLEKVCEVIHAAVGRQTMPDLRNDPTYQVVFKGYTNFSSEFNVKSVPVVTLADLVRQYEINDGIMKVDCEGWEYDVLLNAPDELLRRFERIVIEYHYGFEKLENKLKGAGFALKIVPPHDVLAPERNGDYKNMKVGMLAATRQLK